MEEQHSAEEAGTEQGNAEEVVDFGWEPDQPIDGRRAKAAKDKKRKLKPGSFGAWHYMAGFTVQRCSRPAARRCGNEECMVDHCHLLQKPWASARPFYGASSAKGTSCRRPSRGGHCPWHSAARTWWAWPGQAPARPQRLWCPCWSGAQPPALILVQSWSGCTALLGALTLLLRCSLGQHSARAGARALILAPTRELALQLHKVVKELGRYIDLRTAVLVGGDSMEAQFAELAANPDVLLATPGT